MTAMMTPDDHVDIVLDEGTRLAAMPAELIDAPVPTVPGWTLERVVRHTGKVHRWVTALLSAPPDAAADADTLAAAAPGLPRGADCLPAYRAALDELVVALRASDPDRPVASFLAVGDVAFWARRQAHEVTVHRVDAADAVRAAGGPAPAPLDPTGAIDGIDEWLHVFVATRHAQRGAVFDDGLRGKRVALAIDGTPRWAVEFSEDGTRSDVTPIDATAPASTVATTIDGSAADVFLTCWRRRDLGSVRVVGDRAVATALHETLRF